MPPKKAAVAPPQPLAVEHFAEKLPTGVTLNELRTPVKAKPSRGGKTFTSPTALKSILNTLRDNWQVREQEMEEKRNGDGLGLRELLKENEEIETVKKDNMFEGEVNETEEDIIKKRVELQQKQFQEYQKREFLTKVQNVLNVHPHITVEEAQHALKELKNNEDEVVSHLTNIPFLYSIRRAIAQAAMKAMPAAHRMTAAERKAYGELLVRRKRARAGLAKKGDRKGQRLRLDDALKSASEGKFDGWSEARIKAYRNIETNPNQYFYRFNAPGETQRNGEWSPEEQATFFERMAEIGCDGQWGKFSMAIEGRVGYQCSNFYRRLIESGKVKDPNYYLDEKGKAHYLFKGKQKKAAVKPKVNGDPLLPSKKKKEKAKPKPKGKGKGKKKKRKTYDTDSDSFSWEQADDKAYRATTWRPTKRQRAMAGDDAEAGDKMDEDVNDESAGDDDEELLPGFVDPITLCPVEKPAISPYGHVMGYDNWLKCLQQQDSKNTCCFTKKPLSKRELVILTKDNLEEYRSKIVNWS